MKNGKIIFIFILLAVLIAILGYFGINYLKSKQANTEQIQEEYTPQEEITDEQMRETMVSLYFYNNETGDLEKESKLIDAVELLTNPYSKLIELLIEGPKNENLKTVMPEGMSVHSATITGNCVTVDLSIEAMNNTEDTDLKDKMIYSIVNTLTELTEVEQVKFLVDGEENEAFEGEYERQKGL